MGRAIGFATGSLAGARVAGKDGQPAMTYIPAHTKNGKLINQRCIIPVYINSSKGVGRDGTPGRSDRFRLVAWGPLADSCARSLSNGKAIDCVVRPGSYQGRLYDSNGAARLEADTTPIIVEKVGFTITESPVYGEDSVKVIEQEIAAGKRPINWNNPAHADAQIWADILKARGNVQYVPGSQMFGYARVLIPQGPGIVMVAQQATGPAARAAAAAARAGTVVVPNTTSPLPATPVAPVAPVTPVAVDQTQLAGLIAQVIAAQNQQNTGDAEVNTAGAVDVNSVAF